MRTTNNQNGNKKQHIPHLRILFQNTKHNKRESIRENKTKTTKQNLQHTKRGNNQHTSKHHKKHRTKQIPKLYEKRISKNTTMIIKCSKCKKQIFTCSKQYYEHNKERINKLICGTCEHWNKKLNS